ncbi:MAG: hypothetical protein ABR498_03130 [Candidatus Dormibacteria bacterium]
MRARNDVQPKFPVINRPATLPHSSSSPAVTEPQHHHLPAWVKRAYGQARPILADQLAALSGDVRERYAHDVDQLTARISAGKFSQAFNYQQLIEHGQQLVDDQRREQAEQARAQRVLDSAKRHASDMLKDGAGRIAAETMSRLHKSLRSATDVERVHAIEAEVKEALASARGVEERRREREISRTRSRIQKATPRFAAAVDQSEDWQDVLRRLQEQMATEGASKEA